MDEENKVDNHLEENSYIRIKKFKFIMLIFLLVFATAGITLAALSFGDEKAVSVAIQERKEFNKLYNAFDMLDEKYYENIDQKKLIDGAIAGMVNALDDPYSDYMTKEENEKFQESISASFQGIGAEIQELNGNIVVVSPIKGSPAEKAGIKPNDKIIAVDDKNIQGMTANEAVLLIRGEKGTKVTLSIQRGESTDLIKVTITRDDIPINTVYTDMLENNVAKIQITSFSKHTYDDLTKAINEMKDKGMESLIIDLRRNPGGLLDQAIEMANLFVPEGSNIVQVEYRDGTIEKTVAQGGEKINIPTVVLIDEGSASASEILAGAVSETANIPLIGDKSFGKGTVQTVNDFKDGSNVKYTMAKWLTPNGNWIHKKGIEPDYKVSLPEYANLSYIDPDKKLKVSSASNDVKAAEEMLKVLGYKPGKIDGFYDTDTENAVKKFQKAEKLKENGILTGDTTVKLMNNLSEHIQKNDPQVKKAIEVLTKSNK
ncbi:peptidoglycan-binding protein [Bacillus sp. FJAT-49711]|uniref:lmo1851 family serine protease n=1 Tax=Bacillus sp. FJAT-49711 TaxID=2833585 RepID=UPI001BC8DF49|nr:S41 family peptidase [Bacillus sp. FJAT-49711]MBS4217388.1 peptidoglycan-binding protein [Bacillus sp. FJAT-49711]